MRYYYKSKDGNGTLNAKTPLTEQEMEAYGYVSVSEEEWNASQPKPEPVDEEKVARQREYEELLEWFKYYDVQCMEYARHVRLGVESDVDITNLDIQAATKAERIKELRALM